MKRERNRYFKMKLALIAMQEKETNFKEVLLKWIWKLCMFSCSLLILELHGNLLTPIWVLFIHDQKKMKISFVKNSTIFKFLKIDDHNQVVENSSKTFTYQLCSHTKCLTFLKTFVFKFPLTKNSKHKASQQSSLTTRSLINNYCQKLPSSPFHTSFILKYQNITWVKICRRCSSRQSAKLSKHAIAFDVTVKLCSHRGNKGKRFFSLICLIFRDSLCKKEQKVQNKR